MNFNDFILEAADVRDVDMLDIEVAQLIAEMSVIDAMMDCYEKQMILLEYNEDSAEEIFTEAETFVPAMPEYFEERFLYYPHKDTKTGLYVLARQDKKYTPKGKNGRRRFDGTNDVAVDKDGNPATGDAVFSSFNRKEVEEAAKFLNDNEEMAVRVQQREDEANRKKKEERKAKRGGGVGLQDLNYTAPDPDKEAKDAKKREDLIRKIMDKQGKSREEAENLADKFLIKGDAKATGLPVATLVALGVSTMDGKPISGTETSKSTGRTYAAGTLPKDDVAADTSKTPREDVPKKSFMNGLKKLLSLLGDAAVKLGELIYDAMTSINFVKLGQAFGDRMNKANATTVTLSAKDAALIDSFDTFMDIVDRYGNEFGPNKLANKAGKWVNSKVSGKVKALNDMAKQLDEMNKTDSDSDKNVEVSKITAICDKLGKNDVKKKLREFRRNSAAFKTNLDVEAGVPTELANEMRKFVKKLLSTYTAEAKAVKNILKIAKANDAVEENSESKEPAPVSAGGSQTEGQTEGWSMNLSEDEDFF